MTIETSWDDFFSMFAVFIRLGKDLQKAARGLVLEMSEAGKIVLIFLENSTHKAQWEAQGLVTKVLKDF